jgi:hypothetical protein
MISGLLALVIAGCGKPRASPSHRRETQADG